MLLDADKKILNRIQCDFPLTSRPFLILAQELGLEENFVLERVKYLQDKGYIRRLAPILDTQRIGRYAALATMNVPDERISEVSEIINEYSGVSHNYLRKGKNADIPYNVWFTMSAPSKIGLEQILKEIEHRTGIKVFCLPTIKKFKIGVRFKI